MSPEEDNLPGDLENCKVELADTREQLLYFRQQTELYMKFACDFYNELKKVIPVDCGCNDCNRRLALLKEFDKHVF